MDEGPFRVSRPASRRATSTPPPSRPVASSPQPETRADSPASRLTPQDIDSSQAKAKERPSARSKSESKKFPKKRIFMGAAAIAVILIGLFVWSAMKGSSNGIDSGKYQAVFLTNGQHYFGKLHDMNDDYMRLTDIYYLQRPASDESDSDASDIQQSAGTQNNLELRKLGDEIHGPEDEMIISRENILYYENLKPAGQATEAINQFKGSN